jgi:hypothetical protein
MITIVWPSTFPSIYSALSWSNLMLRTAVPCLATIDPFTFRSLIKTTLDFQNYTIYICVWLYSHLLPFPSCWASVSSSKYIWSINFTYWRTKTTQHSPLLLLVHVVCSSTCCHLNISKRLDLQYLDFRFGQYKCYMPVLPRQFQLFYR